MQLGLQKPWKGKSLGRHEFLDNRDDASSGGVVQDGYCVHEVRQGAQEPTNPVKGGTLTKEFLQRGQVMYRIRSRMQE